MSADLPHAGIHPFGSARRLGSCRSCNAEFMSPICPPSGPDADCGPFVTLRPFAPPDFHRASTLLWPLLTSGPLSRTRSPRVRTCTVDPCRQALPDTSFGDGWISRSLARSSPASGLTACSCSYGRVLATPCFQLGLAASTLGFATLLVTFRGYLLPGNKYMPMSGTLGCAPRTWNRDRHETQYAMPPYLVTRPISIVGAEPSRRSNWTPYVDGRRWHLRRNLGFRQVERPQYRSSVGHSFQSPDRRADHRTESHPGNRRHVSSFSFMASAGDASREAGVSIEVNSPGCLISDGHIGARS